MKHLPWLVLAAVLAYPLLAQTTGVGKHSTLRGPLKVYGIPHPDEWIDFESNELGQPASTYTVPDGHRLTLLAVFGTITLQNSLTVGGMVRVNGVDIGPISLQANCPSDRRVILTSCGYASGDLPKNTFVRGTVVHPGQVLELERTGGTADPESTFTLRGFLEEVK